MLYAWDMPVILSHIPFEFELRWMLNIFTLLIICTNMYDIYLCGVFNIVILANRIYTMLCWNIFDYIWNFISYYIDWLSACCPVSNGCSSECTWHENNTFHVGLSTCLIVSTFQLMFALQPGRHIMCIDTFEYLRMNFLSKRQIFVPMLTI